MTEKERQDAERQSAKHDCLQQLRAIYSGLFDDSVLDLIAAQCGYEVDAAIQQLSAMADDPHLASSRHALQQQHQQSARHGPPPPSVPSPASTAHPGSAWRVQPPAALTSGSNSAPISHRPSPIAQPVTSSTLLSWPSPAETQHAAGTKATTTAATANHNKSKSTKHQQPYRAVLAPPLSAHSASASAASGSPAIRSAPTSPVSALQLTHNQRQASTSSTDSLSPSSAHSTSSLPDMTPAAAVRSPSASTVASPLPSARTAAPSRPPLTVSIAPGRITSHLFPSLHQSASLLPAQHDWMTYSAVEQQPLYYMLMVREARERLLRESEEQLQAEEMQRQTEPQVEEELDAFPALRIDHATRSTLSDAENVQVDAGELLQLLRSMFGSVREELILSVVSSLDCSSINLPQLNECIDTLTAITAEQEADSGRHESEPTSSVHSLADSELSDLDIAKRMAIDPNYSPPRASTPRSLLPPRSSAASPSTSASTSSRRHRIKLDLSKPVHRWQPQTSSESLVSPHLSAKWSIAALHSAFPRIDEALIDDMFTSCGWQYETTKGALLDMFPGEMLRGEVGVLPAVLKVEERKRRPGEKERKVDEQQADEEAVDEQEPLLDDATLERDIGAVLDNRSASAAQPPTLTSSTFAHRRAAFFRAAAAAFMAGKGGLAREYAERGREESRRMDESSASHAVAVFVRANRDVDCYRSVDLHGLTVREAVCILNFVVRRMRRRGVYEVVVVTGRGRNSQGGKSRLRPAVEAYCVRHKYKYHATDAEIKVMWR